MEAMHNHCGVNGCVSFLATSLTIKMPQNPDVRLGPWAIAPISKEAKARPLDSRCLLFPSSMNPPKNHDKRKSMGFVRHIASLYRCNTTRLKVLLVRSHPQAVDVRCRLSEWKLNVMLMCFCSRVLRCQNQLWRQRRVPTERRLRHGQHGRERPHGDRGGQIRPQVHRHGRQHRLLWWVSFSVGGKKTKQADVRAWVG